MPAYREVQSRMRAETCDRRACDAPMTYAVGEPATERRDAASHIAVLRRVSNEFQEMRGLRLTGAQAQRLFSIRHDICTRVLTTLVEQTVLRRDPSGVYILDGHRP
jgi:hypothetical protein